MNYSSHSDDAVQVSKVHLDDMLDASPLVKIDNVDVSRDVVDLLHKEGYELLKDVGQGEGNTRNVFLARFTQGDLDTMRVVKIPKKINVNSLYLLLNTSRKNLNAHEAKVAGKISHPHISEIINHYKINDLDILVEDYFNSQSLKKRLRWGTITNEARIGKIFTQVADALSYLHSKGMYHRDVKSSNILIDDNDFVKLTDRQNIGVSGDLEDKLLPTRGDSSHTHPSLINAVLSDTASSAKESNDIYGLGATIYETITGKVPLDIKLALSTKGKKVKIGDSEYFAELKVNGESRDSLDNKEHERMLKRSLKGVPRRLNNIIYRCMTTTSKAYTSMHEIQEDLKRLQTPSRERWLNRIYDSAKTMAITAATVGIIGACVTYSVLHPKEQGPTMQEILARQPFRQWSCDTLTNIDKEYMWSTLKKTSDDARKDINRLDQDKDENKLYNHIDGMINFSKNVHNMDKRLMSGLYNAVSTVDTAEISKLYMRDRSLVTAVPKDFIIQMTIGLFGPEARNSLSMLDINEESAMAAMYMKGCIAQSGNINDVYTRYFCSSEEIFSAQMRSKTLDYFASQDSTGKMKEGYREFLPFQKRELIDKAIFFHAISDEKGKLDWNKVPKMYYYGGSTNYDSYRIAPEQR